MRVPSIGLTLDERRIVREGRRIAEAMLAGYADAPTGPLALVDDWMAGTRRMVRDFCRLIARG